MSHVINRSHNRDDSKSGTRFYNGRRTPHCVLLSPSPPLLEILAVFLLSYRKTDPPLLLPLPAKSEKNPFGYCCIKGFFFGSGGYYCFHQEGMAGEEEEVFCRPFVGVNTTSQTTGKGEKRNVVTLPPPTKKRGERPRPCLYLGGGGLNKSVVVKGARPKSNLWRRRRPPFSPPPQSGGRRAPLTTSCQIFNFRPGRRKTRRQRILQRVIFFATTPPPPRFTVRK